MNRRRAKATKPPRNKVRINTELPRGLAEAIEEALKRIRPETSRTSLIEMAVEELLTKMGYWPPHEGQKAP